MAKHKSLSDFMQNSRVKSRYVYHLGEISRDRLESKQVDKAANMALDLYLDGQVDLVQERMGPNSFAYIAIRTKKQPRQWTGCYREGRK